MKTIMEVKKMGFLDKIFGKKEEEKKLTGYHSEPKEMVMQNA